MLQLKDFKSFTKLDGRKGKNHKLTLKQIDQKIKAASKRGEKPKKEHVFLSVFYEALQSEDQSSRKQEFIPLFSLLFFWYDSIEISNKEE